MAGVEGEKQAAPFGSWESPLSASFITEESVRLSSLEMSEDHLSKLFWVLCVAIYVDHSVLDRS